MIEIQWWVNGYMDPVSMRTITVKSLFDNGHIMGPALVRTRKEMEYIQGLQLLMGNSIDVYCYADVVLCDQPIKTQLAVTGLDE